MEDNQQNWEKISERFSHLEKKIEEIIEQKHPKLGVEITGGLNNEKIKSIDISKDHLVKIYNEVPQIFSEYAHPVSLTPDTYREKTGGEIYLESAPNGKYWLIVTEFGKKVNYWIVPNGNIKLKIHRLLSIKKLFNFEGEEPNSTSELILEKPAEVSILPSGEKWKLQEKGKIYIGFLSEKIKEENNQASQIKELLGIMKESLQKNQEMKKQIENSLQAQKENHSQIQYILWEVNSLKTQLETIENQLTEQKKAAVYDQSHLNFRKKEEKEKNLVKLYQDNYIFLLEIAQTIELTTESLVNIFVEMPGKILFQENKKGKFLVIFWEDGRQYLVPVAKLLINDSKIVKQLSALFEIINYQEGKSKSFQLVEPGEVYQREMEWELKTKGKIKFD